MLAVMSAGTPAPPAHEIHRRIAAGELTARAVAEAALAEAERVQARINAFVSITPDAALRAADAVDRAVRAGGPLPPLAGVPYAAKDNLARAGAPTTAGARVLHDFMAPYQATVIDRLEAAGAVPIGKTNLDAFGMGSSTEASDFGPVRNPWNDQRVAGGSSGGSAATVAAGVVPIALGTDTGGSVRQPASFCGVSGFKPTYGTLSRYGVVAYASSLDQVGVLARDPRDIGLAMDAMVGRDPFDATTVPVDADFADAAAPGDLRGVRVGLIRELLGEGNGPGVNDATYRTAEALRAAGAEVHEADVPSARAGVSCYYLIACAEASSNLARYDGMLTGVRIGEESGGQEAVMTASRSDGFNLEVRRRILMGTFALSAGHVDAWYGRASRVRRKVASELAAAFEGADLLLSPTVPSAAFALGQHDQDPLAMYLADVDTCLANLAGLPAVSLPAGQDEHGMPLGAQLMAPALQDGRLLRAAAALAGGAEAA